MVLKAVKKTSIQISLVMTSRAASFLMQESMKKAISQTVIDLKREVNKKVLKVPRSKG